MATDLLVVWALKGREELRELRGSRAGWHKDSGTRWGWGLKQKGWLKPDALSHDFWNGLE